MKWYQWAISGIVALLVVLVFFPLIIFAEWCDIMCEIQERKLAFEEKAKLEKLSEN